MLGVLGKGNPSNKEEYMRIATGIIFILFCISAPWISRRWGWRGEIAWGIAALAFIVSVILMLD